MSVKLSTGLRDYILLTSDFKAGVDGGVIYIYNGTPPATADAALAGNTLLMIISDNATGAGINMDTAVASGVIAKAPGQTWRGQAVADGTGTFFRYAGLSDDGLLSTTEKRLQGTVGVVGADLNFASAAFVTGQYKNIDTFNVTQPTA